MSQSETRATFFRQSGWMALATIAGGAFNMFSGLIAFHMPDAQVNIFDTALAMLSILGIPALGMQAAFAAQAATADNPAQVRNLAAMMRGSFAWLGAGWLAFVVLCVMMQNRILALYGISQPALLWVTLGIALVVLWTPVTNGVLQGRQDFLWFGWGTLLNGLGRFVVLGTVVVGFGMGALGGIIGVLAGTAAVFCMVTWRTRDVLRLSGGTVDWRSFVRRVVPLTLGLGALVTIMQADALIVREKLQPTLTTAEVVAYTAARRIAQVMVYLVGAVVSVMFPKVARGFQRTERNDTLALTLALTAVVSIAGATATSILPQLPLRILAGASTPEGARLVIAFVWALVPLALSNVLVWNLLARECYRVVPFLVLVAGGCWIALRQFNDQLLTVITVVGISGLVLLAVCLVFTLLDRKASARATADRAD